MGNLRAWAYARAFHVRPNELIAQMTQLLVEAERQNVSIVGASQDISSGKTLDRMGLQSMMRAIREGYANAVFVRDVSRLSENWYILLQIMERLQTHNAVLICMAEDTRVSLWEKGLSQELRQRAAHTGLGLPWLERGE